MKRIFILICIYMIPLFGFSQNWDINLLKDINLNRNVSLDPTFKTISASTMPLSIAVPAGAITIALLKKDEDSRKNAFLISSSLASAAILSATLKYTINRERPYDRYPILQNITSEKSPSFPSAHTSFSFSLATSMSLVYPKWYIVAPSYLWAGAVGYSRMHLGVHYPSDVIAGAIIGSGSAYLSYKLNNWMDRKWKNNRANKLL